MSKEFCSDGRESCPLESSWTSPLVNSLEGRRSPSSAVMISSAIRRVDRWKGKMKGKSRREHSSPIRPKTCDVCREEKNSGEFYFDDRCEELIVFTCFDCDSLEVRRRLDENVGGSYVVPTSMFERLSSSTGMIFIPKIEYVSAGISSDGDLAIRRIFFSAD